MNPFVCTVRVRADMQRAVSVPARSLAFSVGGPLRFHPADDLSSPLKWMFSTFAADLIETFPTLPANAVSSATPSSAPCPARCTTPSFTSALSVGSGKAKEKHVCIV